MTVRALSESHKWLKLSAIVIALAAVAEGQEPLPYQANFEQGQGYVAGDIHGQNGWQVDQGSANIISGAGREGTEGLVIAPSNPFGQVSLVFAKDIAHEVAFADFWIKPASTEPNEDGEFLDQEGAIAGFFRIDNEGEFFVLNGDGQQGGEWRSTGVQFPIEEGASASWTRLTIRQDFRSKVWDIFINERPTAGNLGFWSNGAEWLQRFSIMGHTRFPLTVDDVSVSSQNPLFPDSDRNGLPDKLGSRDDDPDDDGLTNLEEEVTGTNPEKPDSDFDGMHDGDELEIGRNPLKVDYFGTHPTEAEFKRSTPLPLRFAATRETLYPERLSIVPLLTAFDDRETRDDLSILEDFIALHPQNIFTPWIEANVAFLHYRHAHFSAAFRVYESFWTRHRNSPSTLNADWNSLVDSTGVEYAAMCAHFGRHDKLGEVIADLQQRPLHGIDRTKYLNAGMARSLRERDPARAANCGALAVYHLYTRLHGDNGAHGHRLATAIKGAEGFSLADVEDLAQSATLNYAMVKREAGQPLPLPSIVHWKEGHFALVTEKRGSLYRVADPVFGRTFMASEDALAQESGGHFLVAQEASSAHLAPLPRDVGASLRGKSGYFFLSEKNDGCPPDDCNSCGGRGMAGYSLSKFRGGFQIQDTPIWVDNPYGADAEMQVTYSRTGQRQPMFSEMSHLGTAEWFFNWGAVAIEENDVVGHEGTVQVWLPSGRKESYEWDSGNTYHPNAISGSTLEHVNATPGYYIRRARDGSKIIYGKVIVGASHGNRCYITEIRNPNQSYDYAVLSVTHSSNKLSRVTIPGGADGLGFSHSGNKITNVYDYGYYYRSATFGYSGDNLIYIQDAGNIKSEFGYTNNLVDSLTTPSTALGTQGSISFVVGTTGSSPNISGQYTEVTDAEGYKERVEYKGYWDPSADPFPGLDSSGNALTSEVPSSGYVAKYGLHEGTTLYWDKKGLHDTSGALDPDYAYQYHWMTEDASNTHVTPLLACKRAPLSYRVFYVYNSQAPDYYGVLSGSGPFRVTGVYRVVRNELGNLVTQRTLRTFNSSGSLTWVKGPLDRETKYTYGNSNGIDVTKIEKKEGSGWTTLGTMAYTNTTEHLLSSHTDASGQTTSYEYNGWRQVNKVTDANGDVTLIKYDSDPHSGYNDDGEGYLRRVERTDPDGTGYEIVYQNVTFDSYRNYVTKSKDGDGYELEYVRDGLNRLTSRKHPDSSTETFTYYTWSSGGTKYYLDLQEYQDREGKKTVYTYNGNRQLVRKDEAYSTADVMTTRYGWCSCGDLEWLQDGNQFGRDSAYPPAQTERTTWHRDLHGRVTSKEFEDGNKYTYEYAPESGQLVRLWSPIHHTGGSKSGTATVTYTYFTDGQTHKLDYRSSNTPDVTFTYDSDFGRVKTRADGAGTWTYNYNTINGAGTGDGMLGSITGGPWSNGDGDLEFTYDVLGRVATRKVDTGNSVNEHWMSWDYDSLGRIKEMDTKLGTGTDAFDFYYVSDSSSLVNYINYPNSSTSTSQIRADYGYGTHANGRFLTSISNFRVDNAANPYSDFTYTHTTSGEITNWSKIINQSGSSATLTHSYDNLYRITGVTNGASYSYAYDDGNNRTSSNENGGTQTFATDHRNRLTTATGFAYSYDANGNLTEVHDTTTGAKIYYTWDDVNRLKTIQEDGDGNGAAASGDRRSSMYYDGLHRLHRSYEYTHNGSGNVLQRVDYWLWDGSEILQRRSSTAQTGIRQNYYPRGESYHSSSTSKTDYYYTLDHLGSIREVLSSSGGIHAAYDYTPYGKRTRVGGLFYDSRKGFTGHWYHSESDLYLAHYRAYSPALGRWLSSDPIGETDGTNLYSYVTNSPISSRDPLGLQSAKNPDGSPKEPGQRYEEISEQQRKNRKRGDPHSITNIDKSKQGDLKDVECPPEENDALEDIWDKDPSEEEAWDEFKKRNPEMTPSPSPIPSPSTPISPPSQPGFSVSQGSKGAAVMGGVIVGLIVAKKVAGFFLLPTPAAPLGAGLILSP